MSGLDLVAALSYERAAAWLQRIEMRLVTAAGEYRYPQPEQHALVAAFATGYAAAIADLDQEAANIRAAEDEGAKVPTWPTPIHIDPSRYRKET